MKKWGILIGCVIAVVLMVYIKERKTAAKVPKFVFFYAENQTEGYPTTLGAYKFANLVEEKTNGEIKILVQADGKLGSEKSVLEQLQFGGIDFARISISQLAEAVPKYNVLQMPYLYKDSKHMWKVLDGKIGDRFLQEAQKVEMVGLSWYDAGARNFYSCEKPITKLEDMKELRIRIQESTLMKDVVESLGASAVPIVYDKVYSNLERGIIDGAENNLPSYESTEHYEAAKYYTIDEHMRVPEIQLCSLATWNKLSKKNQEIIRLCARESAAYERKLWQEREKTSRIHIAQKGVQIIELSEKEKARFQAAVEEVYKKYCADDMNIIKDILKMGE